MIPAFLITLREVIEASLIVAAILGILTKFDQRGGIRTVWAAAGCAVVASVALLGTAGALGYTIQDVYTGNVERYSEGFLMTASAVSISWAVFFLHAHFAAHRTSFLAAIRTSIDRDERRGLFWLAFTAVFREGFEIVLFLSTVFLSSDAGAVMTGFAGGATVGILVSLGVFSTAVKLPVLHAFRATGALLILFAAGLFARGIHEFTEAGALPVFPSVTLGLLPADGSVMGDLVWALFGISRSMDVLQITVYVVYAAAMTWMVLIRRPKSARPDLAEEG